MINPEGCLTEENKYLKDYLIAHYNTDKISIAYGRFNIPEGHFNLGKRDNDGKYAFFLNFNGKNSCDVFEDLSDNKLEECITKTSLVLLETKPKPEIKEVKEYTNLFDFL